MAGLIEPILIRYTGLDAKKNQLDLEQLGDSLRGAARIIGVTSNFAFTGRATIRSPALNVRVMAGSPKAGSYEIPALVAPFVPLLPDIVQAISSTLVENLINWGLAKFGGRPTEAEIFRSICFKAIEEQGRTSREALRRMEALAARVIEAQRVPARSLVTPVGDSCEFLTVGNPKSAITIDKAMKDAILEDGNIETLDEAAYFVMFSELDTRNRTGKLSVRGAPNLTKRYNAVITDPVIAEPNNNYIKSLGNRWVRVRARLQLKERQPYRFYVSRIIRGRIPKS